jgi:hypothetical protein
MSLSGLTRTDDLCCTPTVGYCRWVGTAMGAENLQAESGGFRLLTTDGAA